MKLIMKRSLFLITASALLALFTASCGTMRGFGRDVEHAGEHIERSAR